MAYDRELALHSLSSLESALCTRVLAMEFNNDIFPRNAELVDTTVTLRKVDRTCYKHARDGGLSSQI